MNSANEPMTMIERIAASGSVDSFMALPDADKRKFFALLVQESSRRKRAEQRVAELEDALREPGKTVEYTPGEWFRARTLDEMQAFYLSRLPAIREAAKEHGYAIGLHGSTRRDFDLMAMQWRDNASEKDTLAHAIATAACGLSRDGAYQWEKKPCGRVAVSIPICWTDHSNPDFKNKPSVGHIDLSIIEHDKSST